MLEKLTKQTIEIIVRTTAGFFSITPHQLKSNSRKSEFVFPRQIAQYIAKKIYPNLSFNTIGKYIGNKNHATVMYACKSIENSIQTDKTTVLIIENLIPYVFAELNITPKNIKEFMPCI